MTDDIARLGMQIDTSQVQSARDRLNDFKSAAGGAGAASRDFTSASAQMARQMQAMAAAQQQTNALLQQHQAQLSSINANTSSYVDTLAKWATAAGVLVVAYKGLSGAVELANKGMNEQISIMDSLSAKMRSLATYGKDAFQTINDGALAAQKTISLMAQQVGSSGAQFQNFGQAIRAILPNASSQVQAFQTLQTNLTTTGPGSITAQRTLRAYGVTGSNPEEVMVQFIAALQKVQNGAQRTQAAENVFGPAGRDLSSDNITRLQTVTDLEKNLSDVRQQSASLELAAAERRRQIDIQREREWAATPVLSMFSSTQQSSLGANLNRSLQQMLGRGSDGGFFAGLGSMAQSIGAYATGGNPLGGNNSWYQISQPGFVNPNALDYSGKPPLNPQDIDRANADLGEAGMSPMSASLEKFHELQLKLKDDFDKGAISGEMYAAAITNASGAMSRAFDPFTQMRLQQEQASSLGAMSPGEMRDAEAARRQFRQQYWTAQANMGNPLSQTGENGKPATVSPEMYWRYQAPGEDKIVQGAAQAAATAFRDALIAAQSQARTASSAADAARDNPYEEQMAQIRGEAAEQKRLNPSQGALIDATTAAKIEALNASYEKASNSFIANIEMQTKALTEQSKAILAAHGGPVGVEGLMAGAKSTLRALRPDMYDDNGKLDMNDETTQAAIMKGADTLLESAGQMTQHFATMVKAEQDALAQASGGGNSLNNLRSQMGITQETTRMQSYLPALETMAKSNTDLAPVAAELVDQFKANIKALMDNSAALKDFRTQRADVVMQREYQNSLKPIQAETNALYAGANPMQVQMAKMAQTYMDKSQSMGGSLTQQQADNMAQVYVQAQQNLESLKQAQEEWTKTVTSSIDDVANSLGELVYSGKSFKTVFHSLALDISKQGFNYFVQDPVKDLMKNALGVGSQPGSNFGFSPNQGAGVTSWLSQMSGTTGIKSGSTDPLSGLISSYPGTPAGTLPVYVVNNSMVNADTSVGNGSTASLAGIASGSTGGGGVSVAQLASSSSANGYVGNGFSVVGGSTINSPANASSGGLFGNGGFLGTGLFTGTQGGLFGNGGLLGTGAFQGYQNVLNPFSSNFGNFAGPTGSQVQGQYIPTTSSGDIVSVDSAASSGGDLFSFHIGGIVGSGGMKHHGHANAPRFHRGGLLPDEVPIVAQRGERVLNRSEAANYGNSGATNHFHTTMNVSSPNADSFRQSSGQMAADMSKQFNQHLQRYG